jgi:RES domain-containing protein
VILWRISNHDSLNGAGGLRAEGRWHPLGWPIVYCAPAPAAALLEMLVRAGLSTALAPVSYRLLRIDAPDDLAVDTVRADNLPSDWRTDRARTQTLGSVWLAAARTPLLLVPSAIVPETVNVLVNPAHADAKRITVASAARHELDARLLR